MTRACMVEGEDAVSGERLLQVARNGNRRMTAQSRAQSPGAARRTPHSAFLVLLCFLFSQSGRLHPPHLPLGSNHSTTLLSPGLNITTTPAAWSVIRDSYGPDYLLGTRYSVLGTRYSAASSSS